MKIGKLPNQLLDRLVISRFKTDDKYEKNDKTGNMTVLRSAKVGEDCAVLDFGGRLCVVSGDPVTGATRHAGKIAVHVACNDIAAAGVRPVAIHTTLLLPPLVTESDLAELVGEIADTADSVGVRVVGGHTEVTDAVTRVVLSVTAFGAARAGSGGVCGAESAACGESANSANWGCVSAGGARAGDTLIMTKEAGIEGTAILAAERGDILSERFGAECVKAAAGLAGDISVIAEGVLAGGLGAHAMHDVTEGGVLGAAWEMAEASGMGVEVRADAIPVSKFTRGVCEYFGVDPYRLISSGSMLIATEKPSELLAALGGIGVRACVIGEFTDDPASRHFVTDNGGTRRPLTEPGPDELYRALARPVGVGGLLADDKRL